MIKAGIVQTNLSDLGAVKADVDVRKTQGADSCSKSDFGTFMEESTSKEYTAACEKKAESVQNDGSDKGKIEAMINKASKKNITEEPVSEDACDVNQVIADIASVSCVDVIQQIKDVIAAKTGITQEELDGIIKNTGMTDEDLLDNSNIKNLVMVINGVSNPVELITNENVLNEINDIIDCVSEVKVNFADSLQNVNPEHLTDVADDMADVLSSYGEDTDITQASGETFEKDAVLSDNQNVVNDNVQSGNADNKEISDEVMVQEPEAEASQKETADTADNTVRHADSESTHLSDNITENAADNVMAAGKVAEKQDRIISEENVQVQNVRVNATEENESGSSELMQNDRSFSNEKQQFSTTGRHDRDSHLERAGVLTQNLFEHVRDAVSTQSVSSAQSTQFAMRIMNQVLDALKVVSKENMTSMEMQLNPESLGKINVQVVVKEGIVTAQIVAQNEAVKEAIESQITVLKDNMAGQDIKIQEVEVTVSSHAFEENLQQGGENRQNEQQDNRRRKFVDEDGQDMSVTDINRLKEEVKEEIMKEQNGSSVSYQA